MGHSLQARCCYRLGSKAWCPQHRRRWSGSSSGSFLLSWAHPSLIRRKWCRIALFGSFECDGHGGHGYQYYQLWYKNCEWFHFLLAFTSKIVHNYAVAFWVHFWIRVKIGDLKSAWSKTWFSVGVTWSGTEQQILVGLKWLKMAIYTLSSRSQSPVFGHTQSIISSWLYTSYEMKYIFTSMTFPLQYIPSINLVSAHESKTRWALSHSISITSLVQAHVCWL